MKKGEENLVEPLGPCCTYIAGEKTTPTGKTFKERELEYVKNRKEVLRLKGILNPTEEQLLRRPILSPNILIAEKLNVQFAGDMNYNFVTLDVETANNFRSSVCAIGITKVLNGEIIFKKQWLIRPAPFDVGYYQYQVHGLSEKKLESKPTFDVIWPEVANVIGDLPVVCHNASFDYSVIKHSLKFYGLNMISNSFYCSYQLSKILLPKKLSYSLSFLASLINFEFEHHKADEDAHACALITIELAKLAKASDLEGLNKYSWQYNSGSSIRNSSQPKTSLLEIPDLQIDENHTFYGKEVVFTGDLKDILRKDAKLLVEKIGGKCGSGVSKKTNFLVVGEIDLFKLREGVEKTEKLKKAESLILGGHDLQIVDKQYFLELIFQSS